jgi:uncharacterized zinc-type alcohol dehydrogenase-like protein
MPVKAAALAVDGPASRFAPVLIERRDPRPSDVVIDIAYAGICHSDIHQVRQEWAPSIYPMVPGHEITGLVSAVGSEVTKFRPGDRAGVGVFVDSCRLCPNCQAGEEQYCIKGFVPTYNGRDYDGEVTYGGYSTRIVVDEAYVVGVPDGLALDAAAPLLCAGITLYSPLKHWGAGPGKRVAIVGMGGLGHMGVKIASKMGAEVTVLSQSLAKQADGARFGATDYRATSDPATFTELQESFDLIVNTISANVDMDAYLNLLRLDGALVNVGLPTQPDTYKVWSLIRRRRSLAGSTIGSMSETQEMLEFCAHHGIAADIEVITAPEVDEAYERVVRSDVRYRFVIDAKTFTEEGK